MRMMRTERMLLPRAASAADSAAGEMHWGVVSRRSIVDAGPRGMSSPDTIKRQQKQRKQQSPQIQQSQQRHERQQLQQRQQDQRLVSHVVGQPFRCSFIPFVRCLTFIFFFAGFGPRTATGHLNDPRLNKGNEG